MRVRITASVAGDTFSYAGGEVVDLDGPTARSWCAAGMAEPYETPEADAPEVPEAAAGPETPEQGEGPAETTAARSRARRSGSTTKK